MDQKPETQVGKLKDQTNKKSIICDASKHWERLRLVVLPDRGVTNHETVGIIDEWKAEQQKVKERKRKLKAMLEKSIEEARKAIEKAELKSEQADTNYKEVVTNMKRKIIISEHSKMVEKVFEEARKDPYHAKSKNRVANGVGLIRQMEAEHDRIKARRNKLKKLTKEKTKMAQEGDLSNDRLGEQGLPFKQDRTEQKTQNNEKTRRRKKKESKIKQNHSKENSTKETECALNDSKRRSRHETAENMQLLTEVNVQKNRKSIKSEETKQDETSINSEETKQDEASIKSAETKQDDTSTCGNLQGVKKRSKKIRIKNLRRNLPSVYEIEADNGEEDPYGAEYNHKKGSSDEKKIATYNMQNREEQQIQLSEKSEKNSQGYTTATETSVTTTDSDSHGLDDTENVSYNMPSVAPQNKQEIAESQEAEDAVCDLDLKQIENSIKLRRSIHTKSKTHESNYPSLTRSTLESENSWSYATQTGTITREKSKAVSENTMSISSEGMSGRGSSPHTHYGYRDSFYCDSMISSQITTSNFAWITPHKEAKSTSEIHDTLRELGLEIEAMEFEESIEKFREIRQVLRDKLEDVKNALNEEKNRLKLEEKEKFKIKKMRIAYARLKKREKERREREELKQKLREEAERKIQQNRKLQKERMLLAIENNISRSYNYSYFTSTKPKQMRRYNSQKTSS